MTIPAQYRALREKSVIGAVSARSPVGLRGGDRASYLHGLLTNDIRVLTPGTGCYAAWLTPQGRMLTDVHVFALDDSLLLDVPAELAAATRERLEQYVFSEDVHVADLSQTLTPVWVHGPAAPAAIRRVLPDAPALEAWTEYQNARVEQGGSPVVIVKVTQLGVPGFGLYCAPGQAAAIAGALETAEAIRADPDTLEAARIEAGYPVFGLDMTGDTIPLEAGIEDRALSFTKGCYVGQEVIIRVLHRGHGRVARKLVGLCVEGEVPDARAKISSGGHEVGWVTSAATSPERGPVALGYVHRDAASPGTHVEVQAPSGPRPAVVTARPMRPAAR